MCVTLRIYIQNLTKIYPTLVLKSVKFFHFLPNLRTYKICL